MVDDLPDEELGKHVLQISNKFQQTPCTIASTIVAKGRRDDHWAKNCKDAEKQIRGTVITHARIVGRLCMITTK